MAYATTATLNTIPKFYDKKFVERLTSQVKLYNLVEKRPVPLNQGKVVYFSRITNSSTTVSAYKSTEGTVVTPEAVEDASVSATLETYRNAKGLWGFAKLTALSTFIDAAVDEQADQAATIIDKRILETAYGNSYSGIVYGGGFSVQYADLVSGTDWAITSAAPGLVGTSKSITCTMIRKWTGIMRARGVRPMDDGFYLLAVHPDTEMKIQGDSTWMATYEYTDPENMKKGIFGHYGGVKMVREDVIKTSADGSSGATNYYSLLLGKGALAVSELNGGVKTFMTEGGSISDPAHETSTFSWKISFVPAILNVSCGLVCVTSDGA
jgi:N4-gp56 family major capsid protein